MQKIDWLNRLAKWRTVFAGWQLGTRGKGDPECAAVADHRELTLLLRAEMNALVQVLMRKGVMTEDDFTQQLVEEARRLCEVNERRFPGFRASDAGMEMNPTIARDTTAGWRP